MSAPPLTRVASYRRRVAASLERVWENVHDWEHLPWLHGSSFHHISLLTSGDWGWRARIGLQPAGDEILLELVREGRADRYVSRTLAGPGAGTEIWTRLSPQGERTDVEVEFWVPGVAPASAETVGAGFVALYTRLWDEDEGMMVERSARLAEREAGAEPAGDDALDLGPEAELRAGLPRQVVWRGRPFRIVALADGELAVHACVCPHRLGPLGETPVVDDGIRCPWHGYEFDLRTGRSRDGRGLRLAPAPTLTVDPTGRVRLAPTPDA